MFSMEGRKIREIFSMEGRKIREIFSTFEEKPRKLNEIDHKWRTIGEMFSTEGRKIREIFSTKGRKIRKIFSTLKESQRKLNEIDHEGRKIREIFSTKGRKIRKIFSTEGGTIREMFSTVKEKRRKLNEIDYFIHYAGSCGADANGRELNVEKQDVRKKYYVPFHGTKFRQRTFALASTVLLPCAGGTDPKSGQPERQYNAMYNFIPYAGRSGADAYSQEMDVEQQDVNKNYSRSSHGTKFMKILAFVLLLSCAGGTDLKSGKLEHQNHSEIYLSTLRYLSDCPSPMEYMGKTLEKCADVCGSYLQDRNCAYHCMRDSSKTRILEFCAKPKILFDYCPEYDPVDQTIQKDLSTLCNSTDPQNYYYSSDIYFCNPANCLHLHESSVRGGATTLTTLMNETTETSSGETQELFIFLFVFATSLILAILLGCVLYVFFKRRFSSERNRKMTEKRNQDGLTYEYTEVKYPM